MKKIIFISFTLLSIVVFSCKKAPIASKNADILEKYISAYTNGEISKGSAIKVQFTEDVVEETKVGTIVDKNLISFSPSIEGTAEWTDRRTLTYKPKKQLVSKSAFVGNVKVGTLFKSLPKDAQVFEFDFRVKEQHLSIENEPLIFSSIGSNLMELHGVLYTSDIANASLIQKCLSIEYNIGKDTIRWEHSADGVMHRFIIPNIKQTEVEQKFKIEWSGSPLDLDQKGSNEVTIPSSKGLLLVDFRVINEPDQIIKLYFNNPLDPNQSLDGLISIPGMASGIRLEADKNIILIYPNQRESGSREITLNPGIKDIKSQTLGQERIVSIKLADMNPAVRMANNNMILPNSKNLLLPFEAVNLNAVDIEIFKIYNNNILQYLQTDNNDYELKRVGKIIIQKKIMIEDPNLKNIRKEWKKYAIDLAKIITPDPNAFYQIRIGFKPEYSTFACTEMKTPDMEKKSQNEEENYGLGSEFDEGEYVSIMNNYYGPYGYYPDYNWSDRDNPCTPAYFNRDKFKTCMVMSSNIGLIAKAGNSGDIMIIASDIITTEALSDVKLEYYDFQLQPMGTGKTNNEGIGLNTFKKLPFVVVATNNGQKSYLRLFDNEALNISQFDVKGEATQKGLKGFLYGDRGVWRPGDSLYLNFMLDDKLKKLPADIPISFELYDPKGVLQYNTTSTNNIKGLYPLYTKTRTDALTGNWNGVVKAGGGVFNYPLKIETVKPNRLKIKLDFGSPTLSVDKEPIAANLSASWLYGAPAKGLNAKIEMKIKTAKTAFTKYPDYSFENRRSGFDFSTVVWYEGKLNENGLAKINNNILADKINPPGKLDVNFKVRVFEEGGESSQDNFSIPYDPYTNYCGISIPENSYGYKTFGKDQDIEFSVASVDSKGQAVGNRDLKVEFVRVDWQWWWDSYENYYSNYEQSDFKNLVKTSTVKTDRNGKAIVHFTANNWGRYYVKVCDTRSNHCAGDYFYCGYPETDDAFLSRRAASIIPVSSDKEKYTIGEKIKLKLNCPEKGKVLISLENGSKVVKTIWENAKKGENVFEFVANADLAPNVYANVSVIQPHSQSANDLPVRMYGIIPLMVEDKSTRLLPVIKMAAELKPETNAFIEVSETNKRPMSYTIDIVDEGLLDITRFKTPDPWNYFNAREALGVKTWDLFDKLIGSFASEGSRIISIGGDGAKANQDEKKKALRFKPMVVHLGPYYLQPGQTIKHNFKVPNYIGSIRAMVVASNQSAYGNAEKTIPVRKPLMVLASFPRVVGVGETIKVPVNVFVMDKKVNLATVTIKDKNGLLQVKGSNSQKISFDKPDEKILYFELESKNQVGIAKLRIDGIGNGEQSYQEIEVDIRNSNPTETEVSGALLKGLSTESVSIDPIGISGTNNSVLELSILPPFNLQKHLSYLITYPYGCLEQTVSSAFPQLYLSKVFQLGKAKNEEMTKNVKAAIDRLKLFRTSEGGFSYWPNGEMNHWANNYVGHFLLEAKSAGYNVPQNMLDSWLKLQKKLADGWSPKAYNLGYYEWESMNTQAYRLFTLALAQSPNMGAMNRLRETPNLEYEAAALLASAYALSGKSEAVKKLLFPSVIKERKYQISGYTFGSDLRDKAILLQAYIFSKQNVQAANLFQIICKQLNNNDWYSTQTLSFALSSIVKFIGDNKPGGGLNFSYQLDNSKEVLVSTKEPMMLINLPVNQSGVSKLNIKNKDKNGLFWKLSKTGQPAAGNETAKSSNLYMEIKYFNTKGASLDPSKLKRGEDFIVEVTISNPGLLGFKYDNMALQQIFPPGWEINNNRLSNADYIKTNNKINYQDIRDDRVSSFFDLNIRNTVKVSIQLTATYPGKYYLPGFLCQAMYDNSIYAKSKGTWVTVL